MKYEFTGEKKYLDGRTLFRIRAISNFGNVRLGEIGGWIESEHNLSHFGDAWVKDEACVFDNAFVFDDAIVAGNAHVRGHAHVFNNAWVSGDAYVMDNAHIFDEAQVYENSRISDNACIFGNSKVCGGAWIFNCAKTYDNVYICGHARVYHNASVHGYMVLHKNLSICNNADVFNPSHVIHVDNIGMRSESVTFFRGRDNNIHCVSDSSAEGFDSDSFLKEMGLFYGNDNFSLKAFKAAVELAKVQILG